MNKELAYNNMFNLINNGFFVEKYIELTSGNNFLFDDISLEDANLLGITDEQSNDNVIETDHNKYLEDVAARIFNAILIGSQLFDDEEQIKKFVNMFYDGLTPYGLEMCLSEFNITKEEALYRLNHGFAVHFTTSNIADEIQKSGKLVGAGKNAMLTEYENRIIDYAASEQKRNDPTSEEKLMYLFRGWGTGVSSYGSITNSFWMYHTPESLTFLFGDISKRNKVESMNFVSERIFSLNDEYKKTVLETMSGIYDRLVGENQDVCCILIDRDSFEYEKDYYYDGGNQIEVERRPFNNGFDALMSSDSKIQNDIDASNLKFIKVPTVLELEYLKDNQLQNGNSSHKL